MFMSNGKGALDHGGSPKGSIQFMKGFETVGIIVKVIRKGLS